MENKITLTEPLFDCVEAYGQTSLDLIKLRALDKTSNIMSSFISRGATIIVLSMFVCLANIGLALWIGDLLGKSYYGFFCVALFYALFGGVLYFLLHQKMKECFQNAFINEMLQ